jgi:hypothetical protein
LGYPKNAPVGAFFYGEMHADNLCDGLGATGVELVAAYASASLVELA